MQQSWKIFICLINRNVKQEQPRPLKKALEPLATMLFSQQNINAEDEAEKYINEQVKDNAEALQGARDIIAEWIAEDEQASNSIRKIFSKEARVG